ncbi:sulfite exporter TauE/SafE family protein [Corynebacterium massiliense]|uniref:sulfite exporter TauE/SafE family protein n=1 Tax=Corynebacterium massiliense TaxID=441501 RepID=UPI002353ADD5|nr:sulfite exporter TauE/SafE family protein [Corynebacterium massiliense]
MLELILVALAGLAAQLVDGGIGMGFGVTSTTILLLAGLGPAQASAVVHTAELGTTVVSGMSHWRFGNVDWRVVLTLGLPGGIAACVAATVLSRISMEAAAPVTSAILVAVGCNLVWRFSRGRVRRDHTARAHSTPFLVALGSLGGFVDASGGGGWGPVTTSTLMAVGREEPRRIVGTVNTAEFLVSFGATAGFVVGLWDDIVTHFSWVVALLVGGAIAAPVAAWLISRINPVLLGGLVGTAIVVLNIDRVAGGVEQLADVDISAGWLTAAKLLVGAIGVAATVRGALRARRARAAGVDAENEHEPAAQDPDPAPQSAN